MISEHRKRRRFHGEGEIYAALIRPNMLIIVGKVIDISVGGLGIQYVSMEKLMEGPSDVEVFGTGATRVERIRSSVVYDLPIPDQSWNALSVRRCGIKFDQLGIQRQSELHEFIVNHCTREAVTKL